MNRVIWKFQLAITDVQTVWMPVGARMLTVQAQRETVTLWALVNPTAQSRQLDIYIVGTGHSVPEGAANYIATAQHHGGSLVWHVFMGAVS